MKRLCLSILSNSCGFLLGWLGILKCFHSFSASSSTFREPMTSLILSQLFWGIARSIKVFAHDGCLRSHLPTVFTASFSLLSSQFSTDSCSAAGTAFDAIRTCTHACATLSALFACAKGKRIQSELLPVIDSRLQTQPGASALAPVAIGVLRMRRYCVSAGIISRAAIC